MDLSANRIRNLLGDAAGYVGRASHLFRHAADAPHLAGGGDRRAGVASMAASVALALVRASVASGANAIPQVKGLASARIETRVATIGFGHRGAGRARVAASAAKQPVAEPSANTIATRIARLVNALDNPPGHRLVGCARFANPPCHILVAGFRHVLAARHTYLLHTAFLDAFADLAAHFLVAVDRFRPADLVADFPAVLLTHLLLDLAAAHGAVLFIHRLAHGVMAFLLAVLRHVTADDALHILMAMLDLRPAFRALHILPTRARHRASAFLHHVLVSGDVT